MHEAVLAMTRRLARRGPDGEDRWLDAAAGIALGHRRLAIIDLSPGGRQPRISANGRYVVTYNGEIFNYRDLRRELAEEGVACSGASDTEVLVEGCTHWGIAATVRRLVGMFAFALWDRQERVLTLVRDRLGIKPLYYVQVRDGLLFASELKALGAASGWQPQIDPDAVASYLRFGYVPAPLSVFRGAAKLPPASILTLAPGRPAHIETYWDLRAIASRGAAAIESDDESIDALDRLARDAVRRRMIADVPLGAFLSGGIDSSTVVALMQAESTRPVKTFTIGFRERDFDEAGPARRVARHLGTEHHELYVEPQQALDVIPSLSEMFDEPFADASAIPTHILSRFAREQVTVALSGDGGDELFAGYNRYHWAESLWRTLGRLPRGVRRVCADAARAIPAPCWTGLIAVAPQGSRMRQAADKLQKLTEIIDSARPDDIYRRLVSQWQSPAEIAATGREALGILADASVAAEIPCFTARMQFLDSVTYLPDDILVKLDRASMHVGLEARVPLLDHRVVEFAWRQPLHRKLRRGKTKWLLRRVLSRYVPEPLVDRAKMGFGVPLGEWLRGPLRSWASELLDPTTLAADGLLRPTPILAAWRDHVAGVRNWHYALWTVLMLQSWRRHWRV